MQWLGDWLKEIILVILLAAFIEHLTPNQGIHRYVQFVIGLFLLLAMLHPLLSLLRAGDLREELLAALDGTPPDGRSVSRSGEEAMASLSSIVENGKKLQRQNDAISLHLLESRLESLLAENLRDISPYSVKEVKVRLENGEGGALVLDSVFVRMGNTRDTPAAVHEAPEAEKEHSETGFRPQGGVAVEPVRPVHIRIEIGEKPAAKAVPAERDRKELQEAERSIKQKVQEVLARQFNLTPNRIDVLFEAANSAA